MDGEFLRNKYYTPTEHIPASSGITYIPCHTDSDCLDMEVCKSVWVFNGQIMGEQEAADKVDPWNFQGPPSNPDKYKCVIKTVMKPSFALGAIGECPNTSFPPNQAPGDYKTFNACVIDSSSS